LTTHAEERVKQLFGRSIEIKMAVAETLSGQIAKAGQKLADCLLNDGKILVCGNGGSAANAQHFTTSLLNFFEVERPALPVIHIGNDTAYLSSFSNEKYYEQAYARQVQALGKEQDMLLILTTCGNSGSMLNALNAANEQGMDTIILNGRDGGILSSHLGPQDIELRIAAEQTARIREIHLLILHCFCDLIDAALFGQA
jgi:D-sedoheptulose 7-phosphate isomerase